VETISRISSKYNLGRVYLEALEEGGYLFHVEGCPWAPMLHKRLKRRDVTCPRALVAMALYQASTGEPVYVADSMYNSSGSVTRIVAKEALAGDWKQIG